MLVLSAPDSGALSLSCLCSALSMSNAPQIKNRDLYLSRLKQLVTASYRTQKAITRRFQPSRSHLFQLADPLPPAGPSSARREDRARALIGISALPNSFQLQSQAKGQQEGKCQHAGAGCAAQRQLRHLTLPSSPALGAEACVWQLPHHGQQCLSPLPKHGASGVAVAHGSYEGEPQSKEKVPPMAWSVAGVA